MKFIKHNAKVLILKEISFSIINLNYNQIETQSKTSTIQSIDYKIFAIDANQLFKRKFKHRK